MESLFYGGKMPTNARNEEIAVIAERLALDHEMALARPITRSMALSWLKNAQVWARRRKLASLARELQAQIARLG